MDEKEFRNLIYSEYKKNGRSFPWREIKTVNPWGILVSEIMLQQTQTERVISYWKRWIEKWPDPDALCKAPLEDVLREWSGLGYNRRARYLKECACIISGEMGGIIPETPEVLAKLPGIGPYTAGAIACFAYNFPSVFIETNIRSVMLHFFFPEQDKVNDRELLPFIDAYLDKRNPRKWYWALMDYGAALKKQKKNPSRRSAHYNKQSVFSGSLRQIRGSLIRALVSLEPVTAEELRFRLDVKTEEESFYKALDALCKESLVAEEDGKYKIKN